MVLEGGGGMKAAAIVRPVRKREAIFMFVFVLSKGGRDIDDTFSIGILCKLVIKGLRGSQHWGV